MKKIIFAAIAMIAVYLVWSINSAKPTNNTLTISGPFEFHGTDMAKDGHIYSRLGVTQSLTQLKTTGEVVPLLAERWSVDENGTRWQFEIRQGVKFHDGQSLSAKDVAASLLRAKTMPGVFAKVPVKAINAQGQNLEIVLETPYLPLLNTLAHFSLGVLSADSFDSEGNIVHFNATGPYQVVELVAPHKVSLTRFNDYWGNKASIEKVEYLAGHRSESRALQVQSGQTDIAYTIDAISKQNLENTDNVAVQSVNLPRTVLLKVNNHHPYLSDPKARQAISLAINREGIASNVLYAPGSEAYQLFSSSQNEWHVDQHKPKRNLELSRQLLTELGWRKGDNGILQREGKPFKLTLVTYSDRPELPMIATALQNQLLDIGVQIEVSIDNSSVIPAGHHDNTLELALIARNFGMTGSPLPVLYKDFTNKKGSDWGHMNWHSEQLQNDLTKLVSVSDPAQQHQLTQSIATVLAQELPVIPIVYSSQHVAYNKSLTGLVVDPFEIDYRLSELSFND
jgi:peptide/nickel transport system substrate-binding protein